MKETGYQETINDERIQKIVDGTTISRMELIASHTCNMRCSFCSIGKTSAKQHFTLYDAKYFTNIFSPELIHLTGGEITLWRPLIEFIEYVKDFSKIGISTNGTWKTDLYDKILPYLLYCHISLHSMDLLEFNEICGTHNLYEKVLTNCEHISKNYRDLIFRIGIVINDSHVDILKNIQFCEKLGVSDVKLVCDSHMQGLDYNIDDIPMKYRYLYKNLAYRLDGIQERGEYTSGLSENDSQTCYICRDEITAAKVSKTEFGFYPCSVYYREYGDPLFVYTLENIQKDTVRDRIREWSKTHNCHEDSICSQHCQDHMCLMNNSVNKEISK